MEGAVKQREGMPQIWTENRCVFSSAIEWSVRSGPPSGVWPGGGAQDGGYVLDGVDLPGGDAYDQLVGLVVGEGEAAAAHPPGDAPGGAG